jgi:hypothetical protein
MRTTAAFAALLAAGLSLSACGGTSSTSNSPKPTCTLVSTAQGAKCVTPGAPAPTSTRTYDSIDIHGTVLSTFPVSIQVTITNNSIRVFPANDLYISVRDDRGQIHRANAAAAPTNSGLNVPLLDQNATATGVVVFDGEFTPKTLIFEPINGGTILGPVLG